MVKRVVLDNWRRRTNTVLRKACCDRTSSDLLRREIAAALQRAYSDGRRAGAAQAESKHGEYRDDG